MDVVRKITVGTDWDTAIHYQVGVKIKDIILEDDYYNVYTEDDGCKRKWKSFSKYIVSHIEYDTKQ